MADDAFVRKLTGNLAKKVALSPVSTAYAFPEFARISNSDAATAFKASMGLLSIAFDVVSAITTSQEANGELTVEMLNANNLGRLAGHADLADVRSKIFLLRQTLPSVLRAQCVDATSLINSGRRDMGASGPVNSLLAAYINLSTDTTSWLAEKPRHEGIKRHAGEISADIPRPAIAKRWQDDRAHASAAASAATATPSAFAKRGRFYRGRGGPQRN